MSHTMVRFIPHYLTDVVIDKNISIYDFDDMSIFTNLIRDALMGIPIQRSTSVKITNKLIEMYYKPGELVFNDNTITMDNEVVYEITKFETSENGLYIAVVCYEGSTYICRDAPNYFRKGIMKWLVDYTISRLGVDEVVKTELFADYWLAK